MENGKWKLQSWKKKNMKKIWNIEKNLEYGKKERKWKKEKI